jgi:integrase
LTPITVVSDRRSGACEPGGATGERKTSSVWWVYYHHRGQLYRESSNSTKRGEATQLLRKRLAEIGQGRVAGAQTEKTTFEELADMLVNDHQANGRKSTHRIEDALGHLRTRFGRFRAIDISSDKITAYVTHRQGEGAAAATINRELAALKRAFTLAVRAGKVVQRPYVAMLREDNRRKGFFEHDQYQAILEHLPPDLKPAITTAYVTGWRINSEVLTRQRHHVDLDAGWLRLDPGESKKEERATRPADAAACKKLEFKTQADETVSRLASRIFNRLVDQTASFDKSLARFWPTVFPAVPSGLSLGHHCLNQFQPTDFT